MPHALAAKLKLPWEVAYIGVRKRELDLIPLYATIGNKSSNLKVQVSLNLDDNRSCHLQNF